MVCRVSTYVCVLHICIVLQIMMGNSDLGELILLQNDIVRACNTRGIHFQIEWSSVDGVALPYSVTFRQL